MIAEVFFFFKTSENSSLQFCLRQRSTFMKIIYDLPQGRYDDFSVCVCTRRVVGLMNEWIRFFSSSNLSAKVVAK